MRLLRLYINNYRVLSQLDIRFDPSAPQNDNSRHYHLDFLVGVNGTGKSTVLRILGQIFRGIQVSFDELRDLPFVLEYYLESKEQKIYIDNISKESDDKSPDRYFVRVAKGLNGKYPVDDPDETHLKDVVDATLLPERIIAYTTGSESEWMRQEDIDPLSDRSDESLREMKPADRVLAELPGWSRIETENQQRIEKRFRFIQQDHLALITLAGLLSHHQMGQQSPLTRVLEEVHLKGLAGFSLQFDMRYASANARNDIRQRLGQYAIRAVRSGGNVLLVFAPDRFQELLKDNGGALAFFEQISDWYNEKPPLMIKANLFLERARGKHENDLPPLHTWEWLSDGERSFLGRMCLFMLFGEVESLILLDEPEVHFNDYWKRQIVRSIHQIFEIRKPKAKSHLLIATHSSISLTDVAKEDVIILKRSGLQTDTMEMPNIQTFGADPGDIMVHVFGTEYSTGAYSADEVEKWLNDVNNKPEDERRSFLERKLNQVSPGYWSYRIRREMEGLGLQ